MRYLSPLIQKDLQKKMVFVSGPRQCGKTTLAQGLAKASRESWIYLNWDDPDHRKTIFARTWKDETRLLILDELHKFPKWKSWLKGTYDTQKDLHKFLVTGSARLETFRKGGDSLMGRYHLWHLHPFCLGELPAGMGAGEAYRRLMSVGGFPEPFLDNDQREARRWRRERFEKLIKQDIRELEAIQDLQTLGLLVDLLRARVGSPIVVSHLAQDLQKSPVTIAKWIRLLESMFVVFCVRPYTRNIARAVQKPFKVYFFDNADVDGDEGARFENLVACHLLKQTQYAEDASGHSFELCHLRDKEGREVDFLIAKDKKVIELIEVKLSDTQISKHLSHYSEKLGVASARQIVSKEGVDFKQGRLQVVNVLSALSNVKSYF